MAKTDRMVSQGLAEAARQRSRMRREFGRILVVEDDALLAMAIEQTLLDAGAADVTICSSSEQVLVALREKRPHAVVLDIHLADRDDGWAIAELLSDIGPKPPRIVFSTGTPQDIPPAIAQLGTILEKPYDPSDLVTLLLGSDRRGLFSRLLKPAG